MVHYCICNFIFWLVSWSIILFSYSIYQYNHPCTFNPSIPHCMLYAHHTHIYTCHVLRSPPLICTCHVIRPPPPYLHLPCYALTTLIFALAMLCAHHTLIYTCHVICSPHPYIHLPCYTLTISQSSLLTPSRVLKEKHLQYLQLSVQERIRDCDYGSKGMFVILQWGYMTFHILILSYDYYFFYKVSTS